MAAGWITRIVEYSATTDENGWTYYKPDPESLTNALNEIVADANKSGCRVTSVTYLPHQAGFDSVVFGMLNGSTDKRPSTDFPAAGKSHKVHDWGMTIIAFIEG